MPDGIGISLTSNEFIMLSILLGGDKIVGIKDDDEISKMNEQQLEQKWQEIKKGIISKGYIKDKSGEGIEIDELIYLHIKQYIEASKYLEISVSEKGNEVFKDMFFISNKGITNINMNQKNRNMLTLKIINQNKNFFHVLMDFMPTTESFLTDIEDNNYSTLSKIAFYDFMSYINLGNIEEATNILSKNGMREETAQDATKSFLDKNIFINITYTNIVDDIQEVEKLMYYFGERVIYLINTLEDEKETLLIKPIRVNDLISTTNNYILDKLTS